MRRCSPDVPVGIPRRFVFLLLSVLLIFSGCQPHLHSDSSFEQTDAVAHRREETSSEDADLSEETKRLYPPEVTAAYSDLLSRIWEAQRQFYDDGVIDDQKPVSPRPLTVEEKLDDYRTMMDILQKEYPFFAVKARQNGVDWRERRGDDEAKIRETRSDAEFAVALDTILSELKSNHVKICLAEEIREALSYYAYFTDIPSVSTEFFMLNQPVVRNRYRLEAVSPVVDGTPIGDHPEEWVDNLSFREIVPGKISLLRVPKMLTEEQWGKDVQTLERAASAIRRCPVLIIDIRGNPGGVMDYWHMCLLPRLIDRELTAVHWLFFKDLTYSVQVLYEFGDLVFPIGDLDAMMKDTGWKPRNREELSAFSYFAPDVHTVKPADDSIHYKGKVYLLVDRGVYSAAEGMAAFCKATGWATLVGERTGGDGITIGMLYRALPHSGYVFTYTNAFGVAADGTVNEETQTEPDVITDDPISWVLEHAAH